MREYLSCNFVSDFFMFFHKATLTRVHNVGDMCLQVNEQQPEKEASLQQLPVDHIADDQALPLPHTITTSSDKMKKK